MVRRNNREIGSRYEEYAAAFLAKQGLSIIERNYRCKAGEIDIVARDGRTYVFCEVKYRRTAISGDPAEAVDSHKQRKIFLAASWYLKERRLPEDTPCRFDVLALQDSSSGNCEQAPDLGGKPAQKTAVRWIPNAFGSW